MAVTEKAPRSLDALVSVARKLNWCEPQEALEPLALGSPECLSTIATPDVSTDAAIVVLQSPISWTEPMARVEHDQSKNLLTYHELL